MEMIIASVAGIVRVAKMVFDWAVDHDWLTKSPMTSIPTGSFINRDLQSESTGARLSLMEHPLGKVLASGNGQGNRAIYVNWVLTLLSAILLVVLCISLSYLLRHDSNEQREQADSVRNNPGYEEWRQFYDGIADERDVEADKLAWYAVFVFWFGIVWTCVGILLQIFYVRGFARTEITVYEKGIAGIGCGRFYELTYRTYSFQLTYDEITSVSMLDWLFSLGIVIHAPNARYRCYVLNPSEICMAIGTAKFGDGPTTPEPKV